ncbi:Ig-like domain-containing protein [Vibrio diabolicus]
MRLIKILPLIFAFAIIGCKESSPSDAPSSSPAIEVYQGLSQLTPNQRGTVHLSPFIVSGSETQVKLTDVNLLSDSDACQTPLSKDDFSMQFDTKIDGSAMCDYEYTVIATNKDSNESVEKSSTISVVSSTSPTPVLTPIPYSIELDNGTPTVSIKIDDELANVGDTFPPGYVLSDDFALLGDGSVTVESNLRTIRYTAVNEGPHRIIYQLDDPNGSEHRFGSIDIAVSDGSHIKPVVDNAIYPNPIEPGEEVIIDVEPYITSPNGYDLQLVHVNSFNATVSPNAPNDLTNTEFKFVAPLSGDYYVAFMVSDHYGGFGSGIMKVPVAGLNQKPKWSNIYFDSNIYFAPITNNEAEQQNVNYSGKFLDSGYNPPIEMAIFGAAKARQYCNSMGRMPLASELLDLYQNDPPGATHNWPVGLPYWAEDNGTEVLVDLKNGDQPEHLNQSYYVTCVQDGNLSLDPIKVSAIADGIDKVEVEATLIIDGKPQEGMTLSADITGSALLDDKNVVTDPDGKALFAATNFLAEEVTLSIDTLSLATEFIADEGTAEITEIVVLKDNAKPDNNEVNILSATLLDQNLNPIKDQTIQVSSTGNATIKTVSKSDSDGQVNIEVTNDTEESVQITAKYTNSNNHRSEQVATVQFSGCVISGNCLKVIDNTMGNGSGQLFTNPPSVLFLDTITQGNLPPNLELTTNRLFYKSDVSNPQDICEVFNSHYVAQRNNWRLPTVSELSDFWSKQGNLFASGQDWAGGAYHIAWSSTPHNVVYRKFWRFNTGSDGHANAGHNSTVCTSDP